MHNHPTTIPYRGRP